MIKIALLQEQKIIQKIMLLKIQQQFFLGILSQFSKQYFLRLKCKSMLMRYDFQFLQFYATILISLSQQIKNRMSLQPKVKNIRVLSAKITHSSNERSRPKSGIPNQTYTRKQMIETVYNSQGSDVYRIQSARVPGVNAISQNFESQKPIKKTTKQTRQKQQMASQILGLKQTINRLVEQLSHQKGKCENMRKKSLKYEKILTMQFEDEKQWGSNAVNNHLVTGIKNMYDSLKEKYQAKCQEFDNFLKKQQNTKDLENQHYITILEGEIKNLKKKIEKTNELNLASAFTNQTQKQANEYMVADLQNEKSILIQKNKELQKKIKMMSQNMEELQLKIQLDKKLIIEKDNNVHAFERKNKELNKQIQKVKQLNIILDKELAQMKQKYEQEVDLHKNYVAGAQLKCKLQVQAVSKAKESKIQTLQYDNTYLNKMIQDLRSTNLQLNKTNQQLRELNLKNSSNGFEDRQIKKDSAVANKVNNNKQIKSTTIVNVPFQNGKRVPQKADKKYHENAVKTRKIQLVQVLEIAQLIRLKLIAQQFSIQRVKNLFDSKKPQTHGKNTDWQRQYITMAQAKQLFVAAPFSLEEQDSIVLARYLIEDVQQDYVYCDELNENHRQVVKSIIKTLIQQYPVYSSDSPQYYEVNDTIEKYGKNLKAALKTVAKIGTVSKTKLTQIMKSIGMDVQPSIFQLFLSRMALKSKKLAQLDYNSVI